MSNLLVDRRRMMCVSDKPVFGIRTTPNKQGGSLSLPHDSGMVWEYTLYYYIKDNNFSSSPPTYDNRDLGFSAGGRSGQYIGITAERFTSNGISAKWTRNQKNGSAFNIASYMAEKDLITVRYAFPTFYYCINGVLGEHTETGNVYEDNKNSLIFRIPNSYAVTNIKVWKNSVLQNNFLPDVNQVGMVDEIGGLSIYNENFEVVNLTDDNNITKKLYDSYYSAMPTISANN